MLYSNNKYVVVLIDHKTTYSIVNTTNLNTLSTDCINRRLTNASVYLSTYLFNVYYMPRQLNFIFDAFFYLQILKDDTIRTDETTEFALNIV